MVDEGTRLATIQYTRPFRVYWNSVMACDIYWQNRWVICVYHYWRYCDKSRHFREWGLTLNEDKKPMLKLSSVSIEPALLLYRLLFFGATKFDTFFIRIRLFALLGLFLYIISACSRRVVMGMSKRTRRGRAWLMPPVSPLFDLLLES